MREKKIKKGYKVCHIDQEFNCVSALPYGRRIIYKLYDWVKRPFGCGALAVFNKITQAKNFINHNVNSIPCVIFECKYKESKDKKLWIPSIDSYSRLNNVCVNPPKGTLYADEVKLVKEVERVGNLERL